MQKSLQQELYQAKKWNIRSANLFEMTEFANFTDEDYKKISGGRKDV